jgi:redox-sensitive bicupin YhaK (pirin superfamily)
MENKLPRRSFVNRLTVALTSAFTFPFAAKVLADDNVKQINKQEMNPIKSIKPLGFQWETQDPFLFCVHHEDNFPVGNEQMGPKAEYLKGRRLGEDFIIKDGFRMYHGKTVPGFPGHPHRGFETITVVRKGLVDHADSLGAAGRYGDGDVQWMTAGKGVQHSEMFPLINQDRDNTMELFQIWLNLPKKSKMVEPHFKMMWKEMISIYEANDTQGNTTSVEVIAGKLNDVQAATPPPNSWAADPTNEVAVWNIKMKANSTWVLPKASEGINRTLYFYEGAILKIAGETITNYSAVEVLANLNLTLETAGEEVSILVLQGKPINETVIQYGPFVMNSKEEINQAFEDYHRTQFGGWPWPKYDQVHPREKTRFAKHADGREEIKNG